MSKSISTMISSIDINEVTSLQVQNYQGTHIGKHGNNNFKGKSQGFNGPEGHNIMHLMLKDESYY